MHDDEQANFSKLRESINRTSVDFLLTDADVALTFISVAETTSNQETAERNTHNAHKAYRTIQNLRAKYVLTDSEADTLDSRLAEVKLRLEALGQEF